MTYGLVYLQSIACQKGALDLSPLSDVVAAGFGKKTCAANKQIMVALD